MPDITREDCFPDGQRPQSWTTYYGGGTDYTMTVRICEVCGALVRLGYLDRHVASHGNPDAAVIDPARAVPDPSNLDRAAAVVHGYMWPDTEVHGHDEGDDFCRPVAEALAAAGLLVTDEIQAVLDAVTVWPRDEPLWAGAKAAFDAYLATRGPA
jgi:hypothetical protein